MNRVAVFATFGLMGLLAGCGSDGIEFNGRQQVEQFAVRKTPINEYNMPSINHPESGGFEVISSTFTSINLQPSTFIEQPSPGHDLWSMGYVFDCTDNPTCATPGPVIDMVYVTNYGSNDLNPGAAWPHPDVTPTGSPWDFISAWTCSLQNQWFLRDVDGSALGAPVSVDSTPFNSMPISIHDWTTGAAGSSFTTQPRGAQQETTDQSPPGTGLNGIQRIQTPVNNFVQIMYNGLGAPAGLLAAGWRESPAENKHIETNWDSMSRVPVPDYFGGGGTIDTGGGVYLLRFATNWRDTTSGTNSTISKDDGLLFSYYLGVVCNHLIGYGVGLVDSAFALPGVINNREDIMNISTIFDMTAFIAAGKEFFFVLEDMLRMQDVASGSLAQPGPNSTLPGTHR